MKLKDHYELIIPFPLGGVLVRANREFILGSSFLDWVTLKRYETSNSSKGVSTPLLREAKKQLTGHFLGKEQALNLPLDPSLGTPFQRSVWAALRDIPYGETCSYQEIAVAIGNPKGCRAIGMANNKNPFVLFVPCHRVIEKNGGLGGFGAGIKLKKWLLHLEGANI